MNRVLSMDTKWFITKWIQQDSGGKCPPLVFGIYDEQAKRNKAEGKDWIYIDHSYFNRGWGNQTFRAVRGNMHLTRMLDRPDNRLAKFGVEIEPWRKTGRNIVVICPSPAQMKVYDCHHWVRDTLDRLATITDRPVIVKLGKQEPLRAATDHAWAVVTYASVAGVEASLWGIPVFSTPECPSWPVSAGPLEQIETPEYSEQRREWASGLAYASWTVEDIPKVNWRNYEYA